MKNLIGALFAGLALAACMPQPGSTTTCHHGAKCPCSQECCKQCQKSGQQCQCHKQQCQPKK